MPTGQSQNSIVDSKSSGKIPIYNLKDFLKRHFLENRTFSYVKIDCECCEFEWIPLNTDWISSLTNVEKIGGELHSCAHPQVKKVLSTLQKRGCVFPQTSIESDGSITKSHTLSLNAFCKQ